jgi:predicted ester cyclase
MRTSENSVNRKSNFGEFLTCELRRMPIPRTRVHRERGGAWSRGWRKLTPVQATVATGDPTLEVQPAKLLREPLFWASAAAFVGVVVGLVGTFSWAAVMVVTRGPEADILAVLWLLGVPGYILVALSLLGVPVLLGRGSRALRIGTALLLAWLPMQLAVLFALLLYPLLWWPIWWPKGLLSSVSTVAWVATDALGSAAVLSFALGAFFTGARRLGAVLLILGVPAGLLFFGVHSALTGTSEISTQLAVTTTVLFGADLGVAEACLFTLLGAMLLRGARGRALAKVEEENCKKALRLYEVGLAKNDPSVVEQVVSEDFRDPRRGVSGKGAMERICADLWVSYPDLEVSVESQEAEGEVVRTRLVLSGTDRGSGVMWYPPTGRWVSFEAEFTDRFRGGELVEHTGWVDNEGLLRQLGHRREG